MAVFWNRPACMAVVRSPGYLPWTDAPGGQRRQRRPPARFHPGRHVPRPPRDIDHHSATVRTRWPPGDDLLHIQADFKDIPLALKRNPIPSNSAGPHAAVVPSSSKSGPGIPPVGAAFTLKRKADQAPGSAGRGRRARTSSKASGGPADSGSRSSSRYAAVVDRSAYQPVPSSMA
jgi:hypothetical protein